MALLELEGVEARYGQVKVLHGVSLRVPEGRMVAVLGANGAGKTTTLRAISKTVRKTGQSLVDTKRSAGAPGCAQVEGAGQVTRVPPSAAVL